MSGQATIMYVETHSIVDDPFMTSSKAVAAYVPIKKGTLLKSISMAIQFVIPPKGDVYVHTQSI